MVWIMKLLETGLYLPGKLFTVLSPHISGSSSSIYNQIFFSTEFLLPLRSTVNPMLNWLLNFCLFIEDNLFNSQFNIRIVVLSNVNKNSVKKNLIIQWSKGERGIAQTLKSILYPPTFFERKSLEGYPNPLWFHKPSNPHPDYHIIIFNT